jgi:hypothetical protein
MFRKLDLFRSSGEEEGRLLYGPLEGANLSHWIVSVFLKGPAEQVYPSRHLTTERDSLSETVCFQLFKFRTTDKVQKPTDYEGY